MYEELLAIERARLQVAVRIERERGFVFPETSVIVRDVRFLAEKVYGPAPSTGRKGGMAPLEAPDAPARTGPAGLPGVDAAEDGELDALLDELTADDGVDLGEP